MKLEKQLIMTIGKTPNGWTLTSEMIMNSLDTFANKPIVLNKDQKFKEYIEDYREYYSNQCQVIGMICENANIIIEENNVYADIMLFEKYNGNILWKGKFDNWCIQLNDDKKSFNLNSIEVF